MAATITTSLDVDRLRVGVSLAGWSTTGAVSVLRVHTDGSRHEVRGMSAASGGVAFGWDYETPLSVPVTYEAYDGTTLVTSAAASLDVAEDVSTLTAPGMPAFGGRVTVRRKPSLARRRPSVSIDVLGRVSTVVKSDVMKTPGFSLLVNTYTDDEAYSLSALLTAAPVLLLRMPRTRVTDWCYVAVGDVGEEPVTHFKPGVDARADDVASWSVWSLDCQVVDAPVGGVFGDPTSTWQALRDTGLTWGDLRAKGLTWVDVLKGEATA